jgi:hypothetical protein
MNAIFKSAGTVTLGVLIYVGISMKSDHDFEKMASAYQLTPPQVEFAKSCKSSLNANDKTFRGGASKTVGCGCVAANLGVDVDYEKMTSAFRSVIKYAPDDNGGEADIAGMFQDMTEHRGLTYPEAMNAMTDIGSAVGECKGAKLPKTNAVAVSDTMHQPTIMDAPSSNRSCEGLSSTTVKTLQQIADRDGKSLEQVCSSVIS